MRKERLLLFIASGWEIIRFFLIFFLLLFILNPMLVYGKLLLILLLGSGTLLPAAGFLFIGLNKKKYQVFSKLIALGKIISLIPLLLINLSRFPYISHILSIFLEPEGSITDRSEIFLLSDIPGNIFLIILLIDLLLLLFLLLLNAEPASLPLQMEKQDDFEIIQVEDE